MKKKDFKRFENKICEILWWDICSHNDMTGRLIRDVTKENGLAKSIDWGKVLKVDDEVLTICHSTANINSHDITIFPLSVIEKIRVLK